KTFACVGTTAAPLRINISCCPIIKKQGSKYIIFRVGYRDTFAKSIGFPHDKRKTHSKIQFPTRTKLKVSIIQGLDRAFRSVESCSRGKNSGDFPWCALRK